MPVRTVVLGATGFVAGGLIRLLETEGQSYRAVGSREVDLTAPDAAGKLAAILQPDDAVVMCSALTPEKGRDRATFLKNVRMADHVCNALAEVRCWHVVYISSDSVYSSRESCGPVLHEDACCETEDLYGLSHIVREKMLLGACGGLGIPLAIIRPGAIFGADDTHNAYGPNKFIRTALESGRIALFGEGEERRDHVYIRDVARIIQLAVQHRTAGILNAVTGTSVSFHDIALAIQRELGGGIGIETVPRRVPVVHRSFGVTAVLAAFPEYRATPLDVAIREMVEALKGRKSH